ncbi:hypothetical protein, partial [Mycobacterium tuberculosis]
MFKEAKFCLYLWDSIDNIPSIKGKFKYFDRILSFDRIDTQKYENIIHRPLFYLDEFRRVSEVKHFENHKIDLAFFGTIHSDRYAIIKNIKKSCEDLKMSFYSYQYLQSEFIYFFYKMYKKEFRGTKKNDFSYQKMSTREISIMVDESKVILDIQHPNQTGLTMRTIEMIGMSKKIITTNQDIVNYDFYDSRNIAVIDRDNVNIPQYFFN